MISFRQKLEKIARLWVPLSQVIFLPFVTWLDLAMIAFLNKHVKSENSVGHVSSTNGEWVSVLEVPESQKFQGKKIQVPHNLHFFPFAAPAVCWKVHQSWKSWNGNFPWVGEVQFWKVALLSTSSWSWSSWSSSLGKSRPTAGKA